MKFNGNSSTTSHLLSTPCSRKQLCPCYHPLQSHQHVGSIGQPRTASCTFAPALGWLQSQCLPTLVAFNEARVWEVTGTGTSPKLDGGQMRPLSNEPKTTGSPAEVGRKGHQGRTVAWISHSSSPISIKTLACHRHPSKPSAQSYCTICSSKRRGLELWRRVYRQRGDGWIPASTPFPLSHFSHEHMWLPCRLTNLISFLSVSSHMQALCKMFRQKKTKHSLLWKFYLGNRTCYLLISLFFFFSLFFKV